MNGKDPRNRLSAWWSLYRSGGVPPLLASISDPHQAQHMAFVRSIMREQRDRRTLHTPLAELEAVVVDLETTGFYPNQGDEMLSIGAVRITGEQVEESDPFFSFVQVAQPVPEAITRLTGITDEMVADAPTVLAVLRNFLQFTGKRLLVMHGSGHDKAFLNAALWKTSRTRLSHRILDTMHIAKWLFPEWVGHDLDRMLEAFAIPIGRRHDALEDARATARLWAALLEEIRKRGSASTLYELYAQLTI